MDNPGLNRDELGWGPLAAEFISVGARIHHYVADTQRHSLGPLAAEFISVEARIDHYVAGACPTSISAGPWLAAEFISVEAWIDYYVADHERYFFPESLAQLARERWLDTRSRWIALDSGMLYLLRRMKDVFPDSSHDPD
ncbi:MAG: hypothetical protein Q8M16_07010 [Pirellulaceae bacterium]|nr:hypothetical protein [Pirellulaceae bacterium]